MHRPGLMIRVRGVVQGVGFRPYVWRLAHEEALAGAVWNDGQGVGVRVWGADDALRRFLARLSAEAPPLARIDTVETTSLPPSTATSFDILASTGGALSTGIAADAATCPDCRAEIFNPADRRFGYAFTNCTQCGPRLSIVSAIPYDRANTTMRAFTMCTACAAEYHAPSNRRFHAQPNACPHCGPRLWVETKNTPPTHPDPITETATLLQTGQIVAIKGLGGFHLACDATNPQAIALLRHRKQRDAKPFALMAQSLTQIQNHCIVDDEARALLESPAAPIVLLPQQMPATLPAALAPGQDRLGFMLPHTPLHHLLMAKLAGPLVMTSGNLSGAPPVITNQEARLQLADIADAWLFHDRDILNRLDDSVLLTAPPAPMILRRARGYAPMPIRLPPGFAKSPPVLAMGGELKSTFCLLHNGQAILSPHIGDLEDATTQEDYQSALNLYRHLYAFEPAIIAVDKHKGYHSTALGEKLAATCGAKLVYVQHHHAHMAAGMIDAGIDADDTPISAIILDGLGLGDDNTLWGGEFISGHYRSFQRRDHLPATPLPGGGAAMRDPWRNLVAHLLTAFGPDWRQHAAPLLTHLPAAETVSMIEQMTKQGFNSPVCTSAGRIFDAAAAALGLFPHRISYEAQAAMALEALARPFAAHTTARANNLPTLWATMAQQMKNNVEPGLVAASFHHMLADLVVSACEKAGLLTSGQPVILSGGVMQNSLFLTLLRRKLSTHGAIPLCHRQVPANDGGLALGQAAIAALYTP